MHAQPSPHGGAPLLTHARFTCAPAAAPTAGESSSEDGDDDDDDAEGGPGSAMRQDIEDATGTNLVNLRRTIYLTLMSSANFEEAGHKLMKIHISPGQEIELVTMILECCSQVRWGRAGGAARACVRARVCLSVFF